MTPPSRPGAAPSAAWPTSRRRHRTAGALVVVFVAALAVLLPVAPASAHATLLRSDPPDGAVLEASPAVITLTFDETVGLTSGSVRVFDARGHAVPTEVEGRDAVVSASVPARLARGTYVVVWRVISGDSHPVAGSITFSIGSPSVTVESPRVEAGDDPALTRALSITAAVNYLGLFLAGGVAIFGLWVIEGLKLRAAVADRLVLIRWVGACVAVFTAVNAVPLQGADNLGLGLHGAGDPASLDLTLVGNEVVVAVLQSAGLLAGLLLMGRSRWLSTTCVLVAVASPAWVGHSRSHGPQILVLTADALHLVAGAVWFGGLLALALTLGSLRRRERDAGTVLMRFSAIGATVLAVLTATGALAAWRILDSWSALLHTGYGKVLLVKIAVVAVAALVAGFNRWRLLPRVAGGVSHRTRGAATLRVRTAVWCEAGLLVVVLVLTGFLVDLSPNRDSAARDQVASRANATLVDGTRVLVTVAPGTVGRNNLTVEVRDASGEPVTGHARPTVSASSGDLSLGDVRVRRVGAGTYAADVVFPRIGTWSVQVGVRASRFDNPVTEVHVRIR